MPNSTGVARVPGLAAALLGLGLALAALTTVSIVLQVTGGDTAFFDVALPAATATAFVGCGCTVWWLRPHNRIGSLLVLDGAALALGTFTGVPTGPLVTIAAILAALPLAVTIHVILAFPSGRISSFPARLVTAVGYLISTAFPLLLFVLPDESTGRDFLGTAQSLLGATTLAATAAITSRDLIVARRRSPGPPLRQLYAYRVLAPAALLVSVLVILFRSDPGAARFAAYVQFCVLLGLPVLFSTALVRGRFGRTGEVHELAAYIARATPSAQSLEAAVRRALDDPGSTLLYRREGSEHLVDRHGRPAGPEQPFVRTVPVRVGSTIVGAIRFDERQTTSAHVRSLGPVTAMAIDRGRLEAELRAVGVELTRRAAELEDSRRRLVQATDHERRRIARDIHDGVQQSIVLLGLSINAAAAATAAAPDSIARQATEGLAEIHRQTRDLVYAIMPAALTEGGLATATRWIADRMPIPVHVVVDLDDRPLSTDVESAAYFAISELLTNTVKHAAATRASVTVERTPDTLTVLVRDDGVGGIAPLNGTGIRGITDRIGAVGGTVVIESPTSGASVRMEIACG